MDDVVFFKSCKLSQNKKMCQLLRVVLHKNQLLSPA